MELTGQCMWLVLLLSLPPIIVATLFGLIVSLFQALTQIQEQTLAFAVKMIVVILCLMLMSHWLGGELYAFTINMFEIFPRIG